MPSVAAASFLAHFVAFYSAVLGFRSWVSMVTSSVALLVVYPQLLTAVAIAGSTTKHTRISYTTLAMRHKALAANQR